MNPGRAGGWIVKIGGALAKAGALEGALAAIGKLAKRGHRIVIVPGGGEYADFIRRHGERHNLPDGATHHQAILSMGQYGHEIAARMKEAQTIASAAAARRTLAAGKIPVFLPDSPLVESAGLKPGWDVTSDSIAAAVLLRMGWRRLALVKCVDGPSGNEGPLDADGAAMAARKGIVDPVFPGIFKPGWRVYIVNGLKPERLAALIAGGGR